MRKTILFVGLFIAASAAADDVVRSYVCSGQGLMGGEKVQVHALLSDYVSNENRYGDYTTNLEVQVVDAEGKMKFSGVRQGVDPSELRDGEPRAYGNQILVEESNTLFARLTSLYEQTTETKKMYTLIVGKTVSSENDKPEIVASILCE